LGRGDAVAARAAIADEEQIDRQLRVVLEELKASLRHQLEQVNMVCGL
jgi:hypothetical protein